MNGGLLADARFDLTLPEIVTGAVAYWPIRDEHREWKLEVDVDYANWHTFKQVDIRLSNGAILPEPRNWKGVFIIHTGTEYKWISPPILPEWDVSAGSDISVRKPQCQRTHSNRRFQTPTIIPFQWDWVSSAKVRGNFSGSSNARITWQAR